MIPDLFDIEDNHVVLNHTCLSIPELKAIVDKYEDPIPAFNFLHFLFAPKGAYCNVPEEDKESILLDDFPGEYTLEDEVMIAAIEKLSSLLVSPTYRFYLDNKILLEKLGKFAREQPITAGRDGNFAGMQSLIKAVGKTTQEFKQLEKIVQQELDENKTRVRGDKRKAYDQ